MTSEEAMHSALSDILSEGDPSTLYDYGDFANLTTGSDYASRLLEQLSARGFTFVGPTEEGQSTPPLDVTVTWRGDEPRRMLVALPPIKDGLCSGCGAAPRPDTGSCKCHFAVASRLGDPA